MKKLMIPMMAALAMGAMTAFAEAHANGAAAPAAAAEAKAPARAKMTEAQRAEMRARREKFMAERKAKMEAKMLEVVKKYVPDEAQAKALVKELQETVLAGGRRMPMGRPLPPPVRPDAAKPADAAK